MFAWLKNLFKKIEEEDKIRIYCTADSGVYPLTTFVIAAPGRDWYTQSKVAQNSNEKQIHLDSIYDALVTFESLFANSPFQLPPIEIITDYSWCAKAINRMVLDNADLGLLPRVNLIYTKIQRLSYAWNIPVKVIYHAKRTWPSNNS